ncbi:hypothetical protein O9H85_25750 [Paenibacillus filicis]|uniref:EXPERA domain-containing protein n=1 Tax=Paenibacillus gyeongsangnamensis TaxID=3388067 RepID=A0ABT4QFU0_9BACL|nr:hypothetical protein [Paenibacillus filicis]MCZ8515754.1 hypothetical protein [Paenibacillus filicis]
MILYPPVRFDANEWFILIVSALIWGALLLVPRRLPFVTLFIIWLFNGLLAFTADFSIGIDPFDLYDFNDRPEFEWFDVLLYLFMYPPSVFYMLYGYTYWEPHGWKLFGYMLAWALVTMGLEGIAAYGFHVFTYKGWKLWYSGPAYIVIYGLNLILFRFIQKYMPEVSR